jgi:hydrogenase assembly chaperone HypC/HupF
VAPVCLAIPGQIIAVEDAERHLAMVDVAGVRRRINVGLIDDPEAGDWVLIHVGFAMSRIDEARPWPPTGCSSRWAPSTRRSSRSSGRA